MKKISFLTVALLVTCSMLFAQEKLPNTLLWRISGKGLSAPSYLYGTMHLTDKRLFNFGDSVYQAIQATEGFAMEVNPDEMIAYYINKAAENNLESRKLKDAVDSRSYRKYEKQLSKKLNKPGKDITVGDIVHEKNRWMTDLMKEGEMPTIMDAYLYNVAKKQAKWVGGIEDISDQAGLVKDMFDVSDLETIGLNTPGESGNELEKWINLYTKQDINEMVSIVTGQENSDLILNRRNIKMARRMDSLSVIRTMFFAVGAAHLAGDSGVIKLLRDRGFTVQPVISTSTKPAGEYVFKEVVVPWVTVADVNGLYEVSMPGKSTHIKLYGVMDMEFQIDIFSLTSYMSMAFPINIQPAAYDSLYQVFNERLFNSKLKTNRKDVLVNGVPGVELTGKVQNNDARYRIFIKDQFAYVLGFSSVKKAPLLNADADKFMQSVKINGPGSADLQPIPYTDSSMAFSFMAPVAIEHNEQMTKQATLADSKVEIKSGLDLRTGTFIMVVTRKTNPGLHLNSEKGMFAEFEKNMGGRLKWMQLSDISYGSYRGINVQGFAKDQPNIYMRANFYTRGNQITNLMAIGDSAKICSPYYNSMFSSFRFMPYNTGKWPNYTNDSLHFNTVAPAPFLADSNISYEHTHQINSYDAASATSFTIIVDTLEKYSYAISDSAYLVEKGAGLVPETDSVFSKTLTRSSAGTQYEFVHGVPGYNNRTRIKYMLHGNLLYMLYVVGDRDVLFSDQANAMFNQFNISGTPTKFRLNESKFAGWLKEVKTSSDSTIFSILYEIDKTKVSTTDAPAVRKALITSYASPALSAENQLRINDRIQLLVESIKDSSIIDFVKKEYPAIRDSAYSVCLPGLLSKLQTLESYKVLNNLLLTYPPKFDLNGKLYSLTDSLQLGQWFYQNSKPLITNINIGSRLTELGADLCDSSLISLADLRVNEKDFIDLAEKVMPEIKKDSTGYYSYTYSGLLRILDTLNTPATITALKKFLLQGNKSIEADVVIRLAKKGITVPAYNLEHLAADMSWRSGLYTDLEAINKTALFPKKWLTPKFMGQADLYIIASDDNEPTEINFLKQKTSTVNGKKLLFLLYEIKFDSGESYLGIAGGYDLKGKKITPVKDYTNIHWSEEFSMDTLDDQFEKAIESLISDAEEEILQ